MVTDPRFVLVNAKSPKRHKYPIGYYVRPSGCWEWTGAVDLNGYGVVYGNGRMRKAHRVLYEKANGTVPHGLELDHLCRNRKCVNPDHLEPVTHRENILRGVGTAASRARQTHCKHGHEFGEHR